MTSFPKKKTFPITTNGSTSLPRNKMAHNRNTHYKTDATRTISSKITELDSICQKHDVGNLSFKSCKMANETGEITYIDHEKIQGNLRSGIILIRATSLTPSSETTYDIVQIKKDKLERENKKKQEDAEKLLTEIQRLKKNEEANVPDPHTTHPENESQPAQLETESQTVQLENQSQSIQKESDISTDETSSPTNPAENASDPNISNTSNKKGIKRSHKIKEKREKALHKMRELEKDMEKRTAKGGNKYYRGFMKDIRSKFTLEEQNNYQYFEVRIDSSDMLIDNVKVHKVNMPHGTNFICLLVVGDLQMKSGFIRQIDPYYQADKVLQDHSDFLERIKAKEKLKTTITDEDSLDEELS